MIAFGLLLLSSTTLASACTDWKSLDLKKPEIPSSILNVDMIIQENQSVEVQVMAQIISCRIHWQTIRHTCVCSNLAHLLQMATGSIKKSHWRDLV